MDDEIVDMSPARGASPESWELDPMDGLTDE